MIKFRMSEETEVVDMCQAIDEMMADSREDGMKEGMEKGRIEALSDLLKKERSAFRMPPIAWQCL